MYGGCFGRCELQPELTGYHRDLNLCHLAEYGAEYQCSTLIASLVARHSLTPSVEAGKRPEGFMHAPHIAMWGARSYTHAARRSGAVILHRSIFF